MPVLRGDRLSSVIRPLRGDDAPAVADLHARGIPTGFLSSLGPAFLEALYDGISASSAGLGFVCDLGQPAGFVAATTGTGSLYKQVLKQHGPRLALHLLPRLWRPKVIKNCVETLCYPDEVGDDLPDAELLSIVVNERVRGRGIGKALVRRCLAALRGRGVERVKVAVWEANEPAQALYRSCGFELALRREHHGLPMACYAAGTDGAALLKAGRSGDRTDAAKLSNPVDDVRVAAALANNR